MPAHGGRPISRRMAWPPDFIRFANEATIAGIWGGALLLLSLLAMLGERRRRRRTVIDRGIAWRHVTSRVGHAKSRHRRRHHECERRYDGMILRRRQPDVAGGDRPSCRREIPSPAFELRRRRRAVEDWSRNSFAFVERRTGVQ